MSLTILHFTVMLLKRHYLKIRNLPQVLGGQESPCVWAPDATVFWAVTMCHSPLTDFHDRILFLYSFIYLFILFSVFWDRVSLSVLVVLELTLYSRLASNSQKYACLCFPSAGTKDMCHHCLYGFSFLKKPLDSICFIVFEVYKYIGPNHLTFLTSSILVGAE